MGFDPPFGMFKDEASGQWANREVMEAFWRLKEKGWEEGYEIILVSGRRSFEEQKRIWNRKWAEVSRDGETREEVIVERILRYTSVPGLSRHHWGTELDLSEERARLEMRDPLSTSTKRSEQFYRWLKENAPLFGFCQPYRGKGSVSPEPWHWTYSRYSSVYEAQMDGLIDPQKIVGRGVKGEDYLRENLWRIYRDQRRSVESDCRIRQPRIRP